jgi:hypothetical protein
MIFVFFVHDRLLLKRDAHAHGDNETGNDKNIAGENEPEWNEVFEKCVDPVPFMIKKISVTVYNSTVQERVVMAIHLNPKQIARQEKMTVAAEETEENGTPHDDDTST